jgi:hypothetical protein
MNRKSCCSIDLWMAWHKRMPNVKDRNCGTRDVSAARSISVRGLPGRTDDRSVRRQASPKNEIGPAAETNRASLRNHSGAGDIGVLNGVTTFHQLPMSPLDHERPDCPRRVRLWRRSHYRFVTVDAGGERLVYRFIPPDALLVGAADPNSAAPSPPNRLEASLGPKRGSPLQRTARLS